MKLIHFTALTTISITVLAGAIPAGAYVMRGPSERGHPCGNESPCVGCFAHVVQQLKSVPTSESSGKAEPAMDIPQRKTKRTRRAVAILRFLVCIVQELSRELIKNTFSSEKRH